LLAVVLVDKVNGSLHHSSNTSQAVVVELVA